jgi:hypothetical protein
LARHRERTDAHMQRRGWMRDLDGRRMWIALAATLGCLCAIHVVTLLISPTFWSDEALITDEGRLFLFDPHSSWSVNWWIGGNRPVLFWSYIGPVLQELAFRLTAPLPTGPRLASMLGAVLAAIALVGWLAARRTPRWISLLLGIAIFTDPVLVQGYRGGRVDGDALALCVAACWLIRASLHGRPEPRVSLSKLALAGSAVVLAFYVWPDATLLFPLVLAELADVLVALRREGMHRREIGVSVFYFAASGVAAAFILLIPILPLVPLIMSNMHQVLVANAAPSGTRLYIRDLFAALERTPILPVLAMSGLTARHNRILAVATMLTLLFMLSHPINELHVIYLLPYFAGLAGGAFVTLARRSWARRARTVGLTAAVAWAFALSMVLRPLNAYEQAAQRNPNILFTSARTSIGHRPARVFLGAWEFYYPGRQLGWHMFNNLWFYEGPAREMELWSVMDYAIFLQRDTTTVLVRAMHRSGLDFQRTLVARRPSSQLPPIPRFLSRFGGSQPYGPYVLFSRRPL